MLERWTARPKQDVRHLWLGFALRAAALPAVADPGRVIATAGNDIMSIGYTDADGDQVTSGADMLDGNSGSMPQNGMSCHVTGCWTATTV